MSAVVDMRGISRVYETGRLQVAALRGVDLAINEGEFVAILGPSGSGKSTLMHIIGCLDRATAGEYRLAGSPVDELSDDELARLRNRTIGFVFQSFNLLPRTSAVDNVATPLLYQNVGRSERHRRAASALERLGLGEFFSGERWHSAKSNSPKQAAQRRRCRAQTMPGGSLICCISRIIPMPSRGSARSAWPASDG